MLESLILKYAAEFHIDANLIRAVMAIESGGRSLCLRFEPSLYARWSQKVDLTDDARQFAAKTNVSYETELVLRSSSMGPLQVLGQVARELGHKGPLLDLCIPEIGIRLGVMKLKQLSDKHAGFEPFIIASYNAGSPRKLSDGKFFNQGYVDKVQFELDKLRLTTRSK